MPDTVCWAYVKKRKREGGREGERERERERERDLLARVESFFFF
jgi:hypothetical protein